MSPVLLGLIWAAIFAVPVSLLSRVRLRARPRPKPPARPAPRTGAHAAAGQPAQPARFARALSGKRTGWLLGASLLLLFIVDSLAFYQGRPTMNFGGLVPLILVNLVLSMI